MGPGQSFPRSCTTGFIIFASVDALALPAVAMEVARVDVPVGKRVHSEAMLDVLVPIAVVPAPRGC